MTITAFGVDLVDVLDQGHAQAVALVDLIDADLQAMADHQTADPHAAIALAPHRTFLLELRARVLAVVQTWETGQAEVTGVPRPPVRWTVGAVQDVRCGDTVQARSDDRWRVVAQSDAVSAPVDVRRAGQVTLWFEDGTSVSLPWGHRVSVSRSRARRSAEELAADVEGRRQWAEDRGGDAVARDLAGRDEVAS